MHQKCDIVGAAAIPNHVIVGKSKGWPAVDLVAAHNLQDRPDIDGCDHACRRLEGCHDKRCHLHRGTDVTLPKGHLTTIQSRNHIQGALLLAEERKLTIVLAVTSWDIDAAMCTSDR